MNLLERPDRILKSVPFILTRAPWDESYPWVMYRKDEMGNYTETHLGKFYELWKECKGKRLISSSEESHILSRAFLNDNVAYLALHNLGSREELVKIVPKMSTGITIVKANISQLYFDKSINEPVLKRELISISEINELKIGADETVILKLGLSASPKLKFVVNERFYYGERTVVPIEGQKEAVFNILIPKRKGAVVSARLRLGLSRDGGFSSNPNISINGKKIPLDISQTEGMSKYFGVSEVAVPAQTITGKNKVIIEFPDDGGHISTVILAIGTVTR